MTKKIKRVGEISISAIEDVWQRDATATAIAGARGVIQIGGPIPPGTPIGKLSDVEWGWLIAAILFAWISMRAKQATSEEIDTERTIRLIALAPQPWDAGPVATILPDLANECADIDWSTPLTEWSKDTMIEFLLKAMRLIRKAMIARDQSDKGVTRKSSAS